MVESATADRPGVWPELLRQADGASDRALFENLLRALCEAAAISGVALYLEGETGYERRHGVGRPEFPERLPEDPGELVVTELPRARLLHPPSASGDLPGMALVALASSIQVHRLRQQLKRRHFEVAYRGVELEALYDVGLAIASTLELQELYEEILLRAASLLDARRGALYTLDDGVHRLHRTFGGDALEEVDPEDPRLRQVLQGKPVDEPRLLPGATHILAVPIEVEGTSRGVLAVGDKESRRGVGPFPEADRRTLSLFANQAAIALENARLHRQALEKERLERELDLAAEIQRQLLPARLPELPGFELAGWSRPARHVGGDFYDMVPLPLDSLGLVVADVSGKGMPAALLVSTLRSGLRLLLDQMEAGPALLERLNRHIHESSGSNRFITFCLVHAMPGSGDLTYLNAGHNPALLIRAATGEADELEPSGLPLGMLPGATYETLSARMERGDLLCMYSDGITECPSPGDEEFGTERLADLLRELREEPLDAVVQAIDRATGAFACGRPQADDQTVVLLRRG